MKRLTVTYGDLVLFDDEIAECTFTDSAAGFTVAGKLVKTKPNLLEALGRKREVVVDG